MEKRYYLLGGILLFLFLLRLYLAFQVPTFTYDGYQVVRQIKQLTIAYFPVTFDELGYAGRQLLFFPYYLYIYRFISFFFPLDVVLKVLPNLFATFTSLFVYLILERLTHHHGISLFTAFTAGLFPLFISATVSTLSPHTFLLPFLLATIYLYLLVLDEQVGLSFLLLLIIIFPFLHPAAIFLVGGLLFYFLLSNIIGFSLKKIEKELLLFSSVYMLWLYFLFFKKAFLFHGYSALWQNIPHSVMAASFHPVTLFSSLAAIGIIPVLCGVYFTYRCIFGNEESRWYILFGFASFFFSMLAFRLIDPTTGLLYLGTFIFLFAGQFFTLFLAYLKNTKFANKMRYIIAIGMVLFTVSLFFTPVVWTVSSPFVHEAAIWLSQNTPEKAVVLASLEEGYIITAIGERRNVWERSFLMVPQAEQRLAAISEIFQTGSEVAALQLLNRYRITYLFVSHMAMSHGSLPYLSHKECFSPVYKNEEVTIYKVLCGVKEW